MEIQYDTFISQLYNITQARGLDITPEYLFGRTGMGARFSLAMNTKTAREIGHPSSHYIWDIVGVIEHCFGDSGIEVTAYVGPGYVTRARETAAQTSRSLPVNVLELPDYTVESVPELKGDILYAHDDGSWRHATRNSDIIVNSENLPFGPVVLYIGEIKPQTHFPDKTFQYLIDTIERGEAPMEIRGHGNYSTVSGWKAYARWMQSYSVPLKGVQHDHLQSFHKLLKERRFFFSKFLEELAQELPTTLQTMILDLKFRYEAVSTELDKTDTPNLSDIRSIYFTEQKTQVVYKKLMNFLKTY